MRKFIDNVIVIFLMYAYPGHFMFQSLGSPCYGLPDRQPRAGLPEQATTNQRHSKNKNRQKGSCSSPASGYFLSALACGHRSEVLVRGLPIW